jgi:hypothetical protein
MAASVAPEVWGHMEVKRGTLLMLFGGVHKVRTTQTLSAVVFEWDTRTHTLRQTYTPCLSLARFLSSHGHRIRPTG